jgi:hypothetical protein
MVRAIISTQFVWLLLDAMMSGVRPALSVIVALAHPNPEADAQCRRVRGALRGRTDVVPMVVAQCAHDLALFTIVRA